MLNALGTLRVESIKELPATHTNLEVYDADGKFAPVLLVKTKLKGIGIQNIGRPTKHAPEYMAGDHQYKFYMNDNQRVIKITHADYNHLEVRLLADFNINVKAQRVYELKLSFDKEVVQVPVVITCNQSGAFVFVDNNYVGKTKNKILTTNIGSGSRVISIEKDGFETQKATEDISIENNTFSFKLPPIMPVAVTINSEPEGALVHIDNLKFGVTPRSSFFKAGTYPIKIEKENYETINEQIIITEPETIMSYPLTDIRATLTVKTHPNATINFNEEEYKGGINNHKIAPQILEIIVTMPKADKIVRVVTLKPREIKNIEMYPDVQNSTIQVMVIPIDAKIELQGDGGEHYTAIGKKTFLDVPIGTYDLTVNKVGYKTHTESFRLHADATVTKQITLKEIPKNEIISKTEELTESQLILQEEITIDDIMKQDLSVQGKKNLRSANMHLGKKRYEKALPLYKQVLIENPFHLDALNNIASIYYDIHKDYSIAREYFIRSIDVIDTYYNKYDELNLTDEKAAAKFYKTNIKKPKLEKKLKDSEKFRDNCIIHMINSGKLKIKENEFEKAIEIFSDIAELVPDSTVTYRLMAFCYKELEDTENAKLNFIKASEIDHDDANVKKQIAAIYFNEENFFEAGKWYLDAAKIEVENPDNYYNAGLSYLKANNNFLSYSAFQKVLELDPDDEFVLVTLSNIALKLSDNEASTMYLQKAVDLDVADKMVNNPTNVTTLCYKLFGLKKFNDLITYAEIWFEYDNSSKEAVQMLFHASKKINNTELMDKYNKIYQEMN